MKLSKLVEIATALNALGAAKLPAKTAYRVARAINATKSDILAYEEARLKLAESLGTRTDDGQSFRFEDDKGQVFFKQHLALLEEEVSVQFTQISLADLGDVQIEANHLAVLDGYVLIDPPAVPPAPL